MKIQLSHSFENIISIENLLSAWREFILGKKKRRDAQEFALNLMDNILSLHSDLINHTYFGMLKHCHGYKIEKGVALLAHGFWIAARGPQ